MPEIQIADKPTLDAVKTKTDLIGIPDPTANTTTIMGYLRRLYDTLLTSHKTLRSKVFDVPGTYTWTVPAGVTEVYLTGCGAGGGGCGYPDKPGSAGGATSFGNLLTLSGGGGGGVASPQAGGAGAGAGGDGGSNMDGSGGAGYSGSNAGLNAKGACGAGGGGACNAPNKYPGGGAGDYKHDYPVTVTPGQVITITVGSGGNGGAGDNYLYTGGKGGDGLLIVKWWE